MKPRVDGQPKIRGKATSGMMAKVLRWEIGLHEEEEKGDGSAFVSLIGSVMMV